MKYLRSARGIKVGDKFRYKSRGFHVDGLLTSAGVVYDATVVYETERLLGLSLLCDQTTLDVQPFGKPLPFTWTIRKVDVGRSEKLYLVEE